MQDLRFLILLVLFNFLELCSGHDRNDNYSGRRGRNRRSRNNTSNTQNDEEDSGGISAAVIIVIVVICYLLLVFRFLKKKDRHGKRKLSSFPRLTLSRPIFRRRQVTPELEPQRMELPISRRAQYDEAPSSSRATVHAESDLHDKDATRSSLGSYASDEEPQFELQISD